MSEGRSLSFFQVGMKDLIYLTAIVALSAALWIAVSDRAEMLKMIESMSIPGAIIDRPGFDKHGNRLPSHPGDRPTGSTATSALP